MCTGSHMCAEVRGQFHSLCPPYGFQESTEVVRCGSRCLYSPTVSLVCQESHSKVVVLDFNYNQVAHFLFEPNNPTVNHLFNLPGSTVNTCGHRASNFLYITKHQNQPQKATQEQGITPNTAWPWGSVPQAGKGHHAWATEGRGNLVSWPQHWAKWKELFLSLEK